MLGWRLGDAFLSMLGLDKAVDVVHGTGSVQGDHRGYVAQTECDYLLDVGTAVLGDHIVHDFVSAVVLEAHVDVVHLLAFQVE